MTQAVTPLWGIDISNDDFGGPIDFDLAPIPGFIAQLAGEDFVWVEAKCSQGGGGTAFVDPTYATVVSACQSSKMLYIPYHYADTSDPAAQAQNCLNAIAETSQSVMIDFEAVDDNNNPSLSIGDFRNLVNALNEPPRHVRRL